MITIIIITLSKLRNNSEIRMETAVGIVCLCICSMVAGSILLGLASEAECGIQFTKENVQYTQIYPGIVTDSIVDVIPGSQFDNYDFYNRIRLLVRNNSNETCLLNVYSGPLYSVGNSSLYSINETITTNYNKDNLTCYKEPQTKNCKLSKQLSISGILLLLIPVLILALLCLGYCFLNLLRAFTF
jgi:hypothetical protein